MLASEGGAAPWPSTPTNHKPCFASSQDIPHARTAPRGRLLAAHQEASGFYAERLAAADGEGPRAYLRSRGLGSLLTATPWKLGYAPASWTALTDHLHERGFTTDELLTAGLAVTTRTGGVVDRFRDRVMLPVRNHDGDLVGFVGRAAPHAGSDVPKYLNSPRTPVFDKSALLFGLSESHDALTAGAVPVIVEGPFDVLATSLATQAQPGPGLGGGRAVRHRTHRNPGKAARALPRPTRPGRLRRRHRRQTRQREVVRRPGPPLHRPARRRPAPRLRSRRPAPEPRTRRSTRSASPDASARGRGARPGPASLAGQARQRRSVRRGRRCARPDDRRPATRRRRPAGRPARGRLRPRARRGHRGPGRCGHHRPATAIHQPRPSGLLHSRVPAATRRTRSGACLNTPCPPAHRTRPKERHRDPPDRHRPPAGLPRRLRPPGRPGRTPQRDARRRAPVRDGGLHHPRRGRPADSPHSCPASTTGPSATPSSRSDIC